MRSLYGLRLSKSLFMILLPVKVSKIRETAAAYAASRLICADAASSAERFCCSLMLRPSA